MSGRKDCIRKLMTEKYGTNIINVEMIASESDFFIKNQLMNNLGYFSKTRELEIRNAYKKNYSFMGLVDTFLTGIGLYIHDISDLVVLTVKKYPNLRSSFAKMQEYKNLVIAYRNLVFVLSNQHAIFIDENLKYKCMIVDKDGITKLVDFSQFIKYLHYLNEFVVKMAVEEKYFPVFEEIMSKNINGIPQEVITKLNENTLSKIVLIEDKKNNNYINEKSSELVKLLNDTKEKLKEAQEAMAELPEDNGFKSFVDLVSKECSDPTVNNLLNMNINSKSKDFLFQKFFFKIMSKVLETQKNISKENLEKMFINSKYAGSFEKVFVKAIACSNINILNSEKFLNYAYNNFNYSKTFSGDFKINLNVNCDIESENQIEDELTSYKKSEFKLSSKELDTVIAKLEEFVNKINERNEKAKQPDNKKRMAEADFLSKIYFHIIDVEMSFVLINGKLQKVNNLKNKISNLPFGEAKIQERTESNNKNITIVFDDQSKSFGINGI